MTPKQKRTLLLSGIIGTLFACYEEKEKTRLHKELHRRIGIGIRKMVKKYGEPAVTCVMQHEGNDLWKDTVDYFDEEGITIEASTLVLALHHLDEKALTKGYGLGRGKVGTWGKPNYGRNTLIEEKASNKVAKYVWSKVNELYGIEVEKTVSVLERIAQAKKMKEIS